MILVIDCFKLVKGSGKSIGIYNFALNLVRNLVEEKRNTTDNNIKRSKIIVIGTEYNREDFDIQGVEFLSIKYNPFNKLICIFWELFLVQILCKKLRADRVVFPRGFAALTHFVKDTIIVHDMIPFYYHKNYPHFFNKLENKYIMLRLKKSIESSNQVITISQSSKADILSIVGSVEDKIKVIHNGYNDVSNNVDEGEEYILAITSNLPHKNALGIIKSYEKYYEVSRNPLPLIIIGISNVDKYDTSVKVKGNITCFKYLENDKDLHKMIANAKIFLFLSLIEGFGFPPIEAMQLGVPVICSNCSSLPEIVNDAAILVNPNDYTDIGMKILELQNNSELQEKLKVAGFKNYTRFSWDSRAKLYWEHLLK